MPKVIDVALLDISRSDSGAGDLSITGRISGATFQNDPNNPADEKSRHDIFTFPDGPVTISPGESITITETDERGFPKATTSFALSTPSTEPTDLNPKFLTISGDLGPNLGGQSFTLKFDDGIIDVPQVPRSRKLLYKLGNVQVTLNFCLVEQNPF